MSRKRKRQEEYDSNLPNGSGHQAEVSVDNSETAPESPHQVDTVVPATLQSIYAAFTASTLVQGPLTKGTISILLYCGSNGQPSGVSIVASPQPTGRHLIQIAIPSRRILTQTPISCRH